MAFFIFNVSFYIVFSPTHSDSCWNVLDLKIEFEMDDGVPEYSLEFRVGAWELDYEIHADTGDIINHEKERS